MSKIQLHRKTFESERVGFRRRNLPIPTLEHLKIVTSRRKLRDEQVLDVVHRARAAQNEVAVRGVVEKEIEIVDRALILLAIPHERCSECVRAAAGEIKIVMLGLILRGRGGE